MPRRKLSELRAKQVVCDALGLEYTGWDQVEDITTRGRYVVKVDQATKKRFKHGLVALDVSVAEVTAWIEQVAREQGFEHFIIEPYKQHTAAAERYLAITRDKAGIYLTYSRQGGVNIEDNQQSLRTTKLSDTTNWRTLAQATGLSAVQLRNLRDVFVINYFTLLEINPYVVLDETVEILDVAIEVDDAAQLLQDVWEPGDLRWPPRIQTSEEREIALLNERSPASLAYQTIDPNGSLFVLLSGGGASVVVCDEIYNAGHGQDLANYGEYSGNPTSDEVYLYTSAVLQALLQSSATRKALFIGGAVANFTDVAKTFDGICRAIDSYGVDMQRQQVYVVVRRGGPNQVNGLARIRSKLEEYQLACAIHDQTTPLDTAVKELIQGITA